MTTMTSLECSTRGMTACIPSDRILMLILRLIPNYSALSKSTGVLVDLSHRTERLQLMEAQSPLPVATTEKKDETSVAQQESEDGHEMGEISNWGYFLLFSYLYLIQGVVSGFAGTMPFIYADLPDVSTMAIFNSTNLPFSLKFIIAPFLEKFSCVMYGKRKTWFMASLLFSGSVVFVSSFFTAERYANLFGVLCIVAQVGMAFLDISVHAAMIKELKSAAQASIILCYAQSAGNIIGGFLLLKMTSKEFADSIGLSEPITTPPVFLMIYAAMMLVPAAVVQFYYKERVLESEKRGSKFSFCEIVSYYSVFLKPASRYFRLCVYFLIAQQGLNFFNSLYDYNLIEAGFSRNTANNISNIIIFPVIFCTFFYARWTNFVGGKARAVVISQSILIALFLYYLIVFPMEPWIIFVTSLVQNIANTWAFFIMTWLINEFPPHALTGMFITLNASFSNFGQLTSIHTILCGKFGWKLCSYVGLGLQLVIVLCTFKLFDWMKEGNSHVPKEIEEPEDEELEHHPDTP